MKNREHAEKIANAIWDNCTKDRFDYFQSITIIEQYLNSLQPEKTEEELRVGG
jgi:hypothetical protein